MSVILVTGAAGFIGRNLVVRLLADGDTVIAVDRYPSGDEVSAAAGSRFVEETCDTGNDAELTPILQRHRPQVVISLAEQLTRPLAEMVAHSVDAQARLFKAALDAGVKRVCLASSISVYMGLEGPFHEDAPLPVRAPLHVSAIKKADEILAHWYSQVTPLEVVALRLASIYGPRYHSMMNTPSRYLFEALGRPIPPGLPSLNPDTYRLLADFCYVDDCCDAVSRVAKAPKLQHGIYNIGAGRGVTDDDIRRAVNRAVGRNDVAAAAETNQNYLDISRISDELGYRPRHDINSGMLAYKAWLEKHAK